MFLYEIIHRYLKNNNQFFYTFKIKDCKIRGSCNLLIKVKFQKSKWISPLKSLEITWEHLNYFKCNIFDFKNFESFLLINKDGKLELLKQKYFYLNIWYDCLSNYILNAIKKIVSSFKINFVSFIKTSKPKQLCIVEEINTNQTKTKQKTKSEENIIKSISNLVILKNK